MRFGSKFSLFLGAVFALSLAGCGESGEPLGLVASSASQKKVKFPGSTTSADFMVTPAGGRFVLGVHAIEFPRRSICDPGKSGYGADVWDAPCEPVKGVVHVHAEIHEEEGWHWVEFTPHLRFVPTTDPDNYVRLFMRTDAAQSPEAEALLRILWSPNAGVAGIDESIDDPTQKTYIDPSKEFAYRRIKHFSIFEVMRGYQASAGTSGR